MSKRKEKNRQKKERQHMRKLLQEHNEMMDKYVRVVKEQEGQMKHNVKRNM